MESLEKFGINVKLLAQDIDAMEIGKELRLKDIYRKWNDDSVISPTKAGQMFKELVDNKIIHGITYHSKNSQNHHLYIKN